MRMNAFFTGVMAGMAAGAAASMVASNKMPKAGRSLKKSAGKTLHMAGDIVENLTKMM